MFGIKSFKDLDGMTVILIVIVVILIIYLVRRSCNYSSTLVEGLANNDKPEDVKQFIKSINNWEKSSVKFSNTEPKDLNKLANALTSGLDFNSNCDDYENILIDLEDIANSLSLIQCIDMMKQLNDLGAEGGNENKLLSAYYSNSMNIAGLQQFKTYLNDIHTWIGTKGCTSAGSAMSGLFSKKSSSSSSSSSSDSKKKSQSSNPFSGF